MVIEGKSCQLCAGNLISEASYLDTYGHTLFQDKMMLVCQECGFGQMYPEIEKNNLNDFYENFWRSEKSPAFLDFKEWALGKNVLDPRSLSQLRHILLSVVFSWEPVSLAPISFWHQKMPTCRGCNWGQ